MARISKTLREQVAVRARYRCEYCQTQQRLILYMEVDHIRPQSAAGSTTLDNLCYTCRLCNASKADNQTGVDPLSGREVALFNPRTQAWAEHFSWSDTAAEIIGLTETGRATIVCLRLNRPSLIEARLDWARVGWHPPKD